MSGTNAAQQNRKGIKEFNQRLYGGGGFEGTGDISHEDKVKLSEAAQGLRGPRLDNAKLQSLMEMLWGSGLSQDFKMQMDDMIRQRAGMGPQPKPVGGTDKSGSDTPGFGTTGDGGDNWGNVILAGTELAKKNWDGTAKGAFDMIRDRKEMGREGIPVGIDGKYKVGDTVDLVNPLSPYDPNDIAKKEGVGKVKANRRAKKRSDEMIKQLSSTADGSGQSLVDSASGNSKIKPTIVVDGEPGTNPEKKKKKKRGAVVEESPKTPPAPPKKKPDQKHKNVDMEY